MTSCYTLSTCLMTSSPPSNSLSERVSKPLLCEHDKLLYPVHLSDDFISTQKVIVTLSEIVDKLLLCDHDKLLCPLVDDHVPQESHCLFQQYATMTSCSVLLSNNHVPKRVIVSAVCGHDKLSLNLVEYSMPNIFSSNCTGSQ